VRAALCHPRYGLLGPRDLPVASLAAAGRRGLEGLEAARAVLAARAEAGQGRQATLRSALAWLDRLEGARGAAEVCGLGGLTGPGLAESLGLHEILAVSAPAGSPERAAVHEWLARWLEEAAALPGTGVAARLAQATGPDFLVRRPGPAAAVDGPVVRVLTLHAAKGLEWRAVHLAGANEGVLPVRGWGREASWEEERRLFFVGLTRARDLLAFSWQNAPSLPGAQARPSPFLHELPAEHVRWQGLNPANGPAGAGVHPPTNPAEVPGWRIGALVRHPRLGPGVVVGIGTERVTAAFAGLGERSFALALCPLTALGSGEAGDRADP
jgi:hypothetical protein